MDFSYHEFKNHKHLLRLNELLRTFFLLDQKLYNRLSLSLKNDILHFFLIFKFVLESSNIFIANFTD